MQQITSKVWHKVTEIFLQMKMRSAVCKQIHCQSLSSLPTFFSSHKAWGANDSSPLLPLRSGLVSRRGHKANFTGRLFHRNCNGGLTTPADSRGGQTHWHMELRVCLLILSTETLNIYSNILIVHSCTPHQGITILSFKSVHLYMCLFQTKAKGE